jgi:hypothetical protein
MARQRGYQQVCALTLRENFFVRLGFELVDRWSISPKGVAGVHLLPQVSPLRRGGGADESGGDAASRPASAGAVRRLGQPAQVERVAAAALAYKQKQ